MFDKDFDTIEPALEGLASCCAIEEDEVGRGSGV